MTSKILRTTTRLIVPLLLLFSMFLVLRAHHEPGGGFAGGLVSSAAFALYALAFDVPSARTALHVSPRTLAGVGLVALVASALTPFVLGRPMLTGLWSHIPLARGESLDLGTPMLFDLGVYLVVMGATLTIILSLLEES